MNRPFLPFFLFAAISFAQCPPGYTLTGGVCVQNGGGVSAGAAVAVPFSYSTAGTYTLTHGLNSLYPLTTCYITSGGPGYTESPIDVNNVSLTVIAATTGVCSFSATPAPPTSFTVSSAATLDVFQSNTLATTVTFTSVNGYSGTVTPSIVSGLPTGVTAGVFSPSSVTLTSGGTGTATVVLTAANTIATGGPYSVVVQGTDGTKTYNNTTALTASAGIVQQWYLNESSGTLFDSSGNANNMTPTGITYSTINGNSAVVTSGGSSGVTATNFTNTNFTTTSAETVSGWFSLPTRNNGTEYNVVGTINGANNNQGWFMFVSNSGGLGFDFLSNLSTSNFIEIDNVGVTFAANTLYHCVFTYNGLGVNNGANYTSYINGVAASSLVASTGHTLFSGTPASSVPVSIGQAGTIGATAVTFADLRIFNRVITASEALALYNQGAK